VCSSDLSSNNLRAVGLQGDTLFFETGDSSGTAATERMRIDSAGNVGIGTSSPDEKLVVDGVVKFGASTTLKIRMNTSAATGLLEFPDTSSGANIVQLGSTAPIRFTTNALERMRITSAGTVGIGTSSPAVRLSDVEAGTGR
jgi:hypothetical protein